MAGYIGNMPVPQATQTRDNFTATAGQTTFATQGYTPNYLDVYLNGSHLDPSDYTATNGTDVVLNDAAAADDVLTVVAFTTFEVQNKDDQVFTGDFTVDTDTLHVDSTNDRVGINDSTPSYALDVNSGSTNVVANFVSTDGIAGLRLQDSSGNVELSTSGGNFRVQPSGGTPKFTVDTDGYVSSLNKFVCERPNGGSETGTERAMKHWGWRLTSSRSGCGMQVQHGNGNQYGLYYGSAGNYMYYDISLNNASYFYGRAIFINNADGSTRTGIIQWNEYDSVWNTLDSVTYGASGSAIAEGTLNFGTPYGRYLRVRVGLSSGSGSTTLVGWRGIKFETDGEMRFHRCLGA